MKLTLIQQIAPSAPLSTLLPTTVSKQALLWLYLVNFHIYNAADKGNRAKDSGGMQGGKPAASKASRGNAIKVSHEPGGGSFLVTALKVLLPFVVIAAIFLPRLLKPE